MADPTPTKRIVVVHGKADARLDEVLNETDLEPIVTSNGVTICPC